MFRMTRERSTRALSVIFVAAAALAFPLSASHHAPAQQTREDTLLVTSLGAADTPAPDILPEIFRTNIDGSGRKPLLARKTMAFDPALSPDGKRIVFVGSTGVDAREEEKGALRLFVMNADGSAPKRLAANRGPAEYLLSPSWSPDGERIAFSSFVVRLKGNGTAFLFAPHIHLIDPDGQNRRRLKNADGLNPVWSPDGKRLLFTRLEREGEGTSLWAVGVDGANPRQLVKQEGKGDTITGADWSPDGKSLAYAFSEGYRFDQEGKGPGLFVARADGSQPRRVAGGPKEIVFGVKWSADGKRLFFTRRDRSGPLLEKNEKNPAGGRDWGPCAVYAIDVDGRNLRHVTMGNQREYVGGNFLFAMKMLVR